MVERERERGLLGNTTVYFQQVFLCEQNFCFTNTAEEKGRVFQPRCALWHCKDIVVLLSVGRSQMFVSRLMRSYEPAFPYVLDSVPIPIRPLIFLYVL